MIVVTAGTTEYRSIVDAQAKRCAEFGYRHMIFDLGGLGIGTPHAVEIEDLQPTVNGDSLPPATFKAGLLATALQSAGEGEVCCWLDADCIPLREFVPPNQAMWDAAVTLRPAAEIGLSNNPSLDYLNSGVVWIRKTRMGLMFCSQWAKLSVEMLTDQGALNEVVAPRVHSAITWNSLRGRIHDRTLVLDATEWNCWNFPHPANARILHFKRGVRHLAKDYLNR